MLLFFRQMFLTRACVCVLFIGIVQRYCACLTWKSALEIKSLLLLLLHVSSNLVCQFLSVCTVYRNVNEQENFLLVSVSAGCTSLLDFCLFVFVFVFVFVFCFFFVPQLYLWGSPLLGEIFAYVTVFFLIQPLR